MPTNHTPNYQLSQWSRDDRILMDDFNADNAKIDEALGTLAKTTAAHAALLPRLGNCAISAGTYIGNGDNNPIVRTFPGRPLFLYVQDGVTPLAIQAVRGMTTDYTIMGADYRYSLVWGDRSVSWTYGAGALGYSLNVKERPYFYVILLAMDE